MHSRKVVLFIAMSLDGYIATKDDGLGWLDVVDRDGEDYGYDEMCKRCDVNIVGRATYDVVLKLTGGKYPPADLFRCIVLTRSIREPENGVTFYNGDIEDLVTKLKSEPGKDIYCDGGGEIVKLLLERGLIDEFIISVIPTVLGDGKRLFLGGLPKSQSLELISSKSFESGLVQLRYRRSN